MEWIMQNWDLIFKGIGSIVVGASVLAKLTPTEVDDMWLARILRFIDFLAINNKPTEQSKRLR